MRISRRTRKRLRSRRGATIVLVAMMIVVLIGFVGVGVDFARMYAFKTQLKTVTDASAMAGAIEMMNGRRSNLEPEILALAQRPLNNVDGANTAQVGGADVDAVTWDFDTRQVTASFGDAYQAPEVNAIRVIGRYPAPFTFGTIFGITSATLVDTTVAALGAVGSSNCLKPWAVPYENILWTLGKANPRDTSYVLTEDDVADLRDNRKNIAFKVTSQTDSLVTDQFGNTIPGNYFPVRFPAYADVNRNPYPNAPAPGGDDYRDAIGNVCEAGAVRVGDFLKVEQGVKVGPTKQGVEKLCEVSGGGKTFACNKDIELPIWAGSYKLGGVPSVQVKYIGAFHLTMYDDGTVMGYLTSISATQGGGFTGANGPVVKGAIVY